jgi:SPP1 family predicted phage head-tail adaptor
MDGFTLKAGHLNRSVTLQVKTTTQTATGYPEETWSDVATVRARRLDVGGQERIQAERELASRTAKFLIRWREGVTAEHRLKEGDQVWDIEGIAEMGRREALEITAVAQPDGGS